jgi:hypothetical protein
MKFADVLAYIGGLLGLIASIIKLIFYSYNVWCY